VESAPFVSVVTPIHNARGYLSECIESVLRQTYQNWEYILVDNGSIDGSAEVASSYALRFPGKIRLVRTETCLSEVQNCNFALSLIAPESKYCKVVLAEDWVYPECLARMVALAEWDCSIGVVSSYRLRGNRVLGEGLPYTTTVVAGTNICRQQLTTPLFIFGTPTTVLYRSEIIRKHSPFYDEATLHEGTDACYRTLHSWNFGFVHQVLSFSRVEADSNPQSAADDHPAYLARLLQLSKFGPAYLDSDELMVAMREGRAKYYNFLARRLLGGWSRTFWQYQISGLRSGGLRLDKMTLLKHIFLQLLWIVSNPGLAGVRLTARLRTD
jgi:glycosyltransferase involved in cell wall biosynthesis